MIKYDSNKADYENSTIPEIGNNKATVTLRILGRGYKEAPFTE